MDDVPPERIPLRAIAEKAKVSRMTVSRALRGDSSISKVTGERVSRIARQLGYRRDPTLNRLMEVIRIRKKHRSANVIAYLTAFESPAVWRNHPVLRRYYSAAAERAAVAGYKIEEFWARQPGMSQQRLSEIIRNRGIEGVIIPPLPVPGPFFEHLRWEYFSAVAIGYTLSDPQLHRVCNHQFQSMMLVATRLHEMGYQRIGLCMDSRQDDRVNHHWRAAHLAVQSMWGPGRKLMLVESALDRNAFARWFAAARPDAIITIGPSVEQWLRQIKVRVPEDVGVANVDLRLDMKDTTGIEQNSHLVGSAAVDMLVSLINNNERGVPAVPRVTMVQGTFVERKTTRWLVRQPAGPVS